MQTLYPGDYANETKRGIICSALIILLEVAKGKSLATSPRNQSSKSGLIHTAPVFACSWACPRPERCSIPYYYHIINNN